MGDASVFAKDLAGVGIDQVERVPIAELDLSSPDLRRHASPTPGRVEPISYTRQVAAEPVRQATDSDARALIARAVAAKGGLDLLRSIQTVRMESITTIQTNGTSADLPGTITIRYPAAFRMEATTPAGRLVQVFNAGRYCVHDAPDTMAEQIRGSVQRDTVPLLLALTDGKVAAQATHVTDGGRTLPALDVALPGAARLTLIFDPSTGLLAKARYGPNAQDGAGVSVEEVYSDYRDINGLKVAFKTDVRRDGTLSFTRTVRAFEFNVPVEPALFSKPS